MDKKTKARMRQDKALCSHCGSHHIGTYTSKPIYYNGTRPIFRCLSCHHEWTAGIDGMPYIQYAKPITNNP